MRIQSGQYKGRKLLSPPGTRGVQGTVGGARGPGRPRQAITRPITAAVKKSLFGMLGERVRGATVLDLYCGTGTLGLEALSQGARRVFFGERNRLVLSRLGRNIETLGASEACTVWAGDVPGRLGGWLATLDAPVDLAFVDPPYAEARRWAGRDAWSSAAQKIFAPLAGRLAPDGIVVFRCDAGAVPPDRMGGLAARRVRRYGGMILTLLVREEPSD